MQIREAALGIWTLTKEEQTDISLSSWGPGKEVWKEKEIIHVYKVRRRKWN